jgi:hypothetical protein
MNTDKITQLSKIGLTEFKSLKKHNPIAIESKKFIKG